MECGVSNRLMTVAIRHWLALCLLVLPSCVWAQHASVHQMMTSVSRREGVFFVYDASLDLSQPYKGVSLDGKPLRECLSLLFDGTDIHYRRHGKNVMLWRDKHPKPARPREQPQKEKLFVVCGTVKDENGEPVINASVFNPRTRQGVLTNERGQYCLRLSAGRHSLTASFTGCTPQTTSLLLKKNTTLDFSLQSTLELAEVTVVADMNSPTLTTTTGKRTLTAADINTEFSLLSSPDLVKTLQRTSGVAGGVELTSGLMVHGGNGDENLFLLDGTPLYQTNHSLGLFSAFNTDIIKNVDFYKSGFPARYSGRVSSITDVRTRDGDAQQIRGLFSLGLVDGRLQVEGPIVKDKTSFNIALRRSWIDLLLKPAYALINSQAGDGEKYSFGYAFHDLNARITHRLCNGQSLWLSVYEGSDHYSIGDQSAWDGYFTDTNNRIGWGNLNVALGADVRLSHTLSLAATAIGSYSRSHQSSDEDDTYHYADGTRRRFSLAINDNHTRMHDLGAKADFRWEAGRGHRIRFGGSYIHHVFRPQTTRQTFYYGDASESVDTSFVEERSRTASDEMTLYAEDEMDLTQRLSASLGCSYTLTHVSGRIYHLLDPRLAFRHRLNDHLTLKLSYTRMSQSVHRIASTFLELPADFWVPTTSTLRPTQSWQMAGGVYLQQGPWTATLESFYKRTDHLLTYRNWMGLQPVAALWQDNVTVGKGRSWGAELDVFYRTPRVRASLSYTLSWSKRLFPEIQDGWYNDQFDNRHKLDLSLRYKLSRRISAYAAWTYHSGNRVTLPVGYAPQPQMPGEKETMTGGFIYGQPNNFTLPAYHRLDIGADFHHTTKRGRDCIWNVSLYNAYCHLNTMYVKLQGHSDGTVSAQCKGFIPVIPSVSYTIKF